MPALTIKVRPETAADVPAIRQVNESAFPTRQEADLVDLCRQHGKVALSLVAVVDGNVVGKLVPEKMVSIVRELDS